MTHRNAIVSDQQERGHDRPRLASLIGTCKINRAAACAHQRDNFMKPAHVHLGRGIQDRMSRVSVQEIQEERGLGIVVPDARLRIPILPSPLHPARMNKMGRGRRSRARSNPVVRIHRPGCAARSG